MPGDDALDLGGKNLESAGVDHVLLAVDDKNRAVLVHRGEIAGM